MKRFLELLPIPLCGIMLALASLGNLIENICKKMLDNAVLGKDIHLVFGIVVLALLIMMTLKFLVCFKMVRKMLENPEIFGIFCCYFLTLMIFSGYIAEWWSATPARVIWWAGVILHICAMAVFTWRYVLHFKWPQLMPPWYIVYVGFSLCGMSSADYAPVWFGQASFWFGLTSFCILFILLFYRIRKFGLPMMYEPTLCINAALGIVLTGYTRNFENPWVPLIFILYFASLLIWIWLLFKLPSLLKLPFYPSDAAFSFPFVVSAIASMEAMRKLMELKINIMSWNTPVVWAQTAVACFMIGLCIWRFSRHLMSAWKNPNSQEKMMGMNMMDTARNMDSKMEMA